MYTDSQSYF